MYRCLLVAMALLCGCGRYFPGPLVPAKQEAAEMTVSDDGTVTYHLRRLEVSLRPMLDEQLNRQFAAESDGGAESTNPYTFGDWRRLGDSYTPARFTVFLLTVNNYEFPKVRVDPSRVMISSSNNRTYYGFAYGQLDEYFRAYWQGRTGAGRSAFRERTDLLRRTLFAGNPTFSGQSESGYLVFPALHDDVKDIVVRLSDVEVRYDFAGKPVETLQLAYPFHRDVYRGYRPPEAPANQKAAQ